MQSYVDSATPPTLELISEWMSNMGDDYREEEDTEWPLVLLEHEWRKFTFNLCVALGVGIYGVPGQACRLTERYLCEVFRSTPSGSTVERTSEFTNALRTKMPLVIASCIQLAAKMKSFRLNIKMVQECLMKQRFNCTIGDIREAEFAVFKTINFRIPLWTSVEAAQAVAVHIGLHNKLMITVKMIMHITESLRDELDRRIQMKAKKCAVCKIYTTTIVRTLHLVAGCLVAANIYMDHPEEESLNKVSGLMHIPLCYTNLICQTIIGVLNVDEARASRKRKLSQD